MQIAHTLWSIVITRQRLEKIKRKASDPEEKDNSTTQSAFAVDDEDGIHSTDAILVGPFLPIFDMHILPVI